MQMYAEALESIGFYTLSDERTQNASVDSPLMRCELILTNKCNFTCPYCRHVGQYIGVDAAKVLLSKWATHHLYAVRFSGGEPTLYSHLEELVHWAFVLGIPRIALSTNGSASFETYLKLWLAGVNDFSISLDACCAEDGDKMAGGVKGAWEMVVGNIKTLSKLTYVTVGVVLNEDNQKSINEIIRFADSLGVSDIRIIPAAQTGQRFTEVEVDQDLLDKYSILRYRIRNFVGGYSVRGLEGADTNKCPLVLDDMAVMGYAHYPCIIYMREGGAPIGSTEVSIEEMRQAREDWYEQHDTKEDPICAEQCLDVCRHYNWRHDKNSR